MRLTEQQRRYRRMKRAGLCVSCADKRGARAGKAYCRACIKHLYPPAPPRLRTWQPPRIPAAPVAPLYTRTSGTLAARRRAIGLCPCGDTNPVNGACARCTEAA